MLYPIQSNFLYLNVFYLLRNNNIFIFIHVILHFMYIITIYIIFIYYSVIIPFIILLFLLFYYYMFKIFLIKSKFNNLELKNES